MGEVAGWFGLGLAIFCGVCGVRRWNTRYVFVLAGHCGGEADGMGWDGFGEGRER